MLRSRISHIVFVMAICLAGNAFGQLPTLDGTWQPERGSMHGEVVPTSALQAMSLIFSNGTFKASSGAMSSTGRINPAGQANQVEMTIETGADQGRLIKVLYKLEGAALTLTFSETGDFPSTHDSTADNKYLTLIYKKQGGANSPPIVNIPAGGSSGTGSAVVD